MQYITRTENHPTSRGMASVRFAVPIDDSGQFILAANSSDDDDRGIPRSNIVALPPPSYDEVISDPAAPIPAGMCLFVTSDTISFP